MAAPTFNAGAPVGTYAALAAENSTAANSPCVALPTDQILQLQAAQGFIALTPSDSSVYTPGRGFEVICTVAGNVTIVAPDSSSHTVPVSVGFNFFPYAVKKLMATGTTATATYSSYV